MHAWFRPPVDVPGSLGVRSRDISPLAAGWLDRWPDRRHTDADLRNFYYLVPTYCASAAASSRYQRLQRVCHRAQADLLVADARRPPRAPLRRGRRLRGAHAAAADPRRLPTASRPTDSLKPRHLRAAWSFVSVS